MMESTEPLPQSSGVSTQVLLPASALILGSGVLALAVFGVGSRVQKHIRREPGCKSSGFSYALCSLSFREDLLAAIRRIAVTYSRLI